MSLITPLLARIQNPVLENTQHSTDPVGFTQNALQTIISIFFIVGVIYFMWHFLMAAYHMISSQGDSKKFEDAKNAITYAAIGLFIVFAVFAVLKFVGFILGIDGLDNLQLTFPTL